MAGVAKGRAVHPPLPVPPTLYLLRAPQLALLLPGVALAACMLVGKTCTQRALSVNQCTDMTRY